MPLQNGRLPPKTGGLTGLRSKRHILSAFFKAVNLMGEYNVPMKIKVKPNRNDTVVPGNFMFTVYLHKSTIDQQFIFRDYNLNS